MPWDLSAFGIVICAVFSHSGRLQEFLLMDPEQFCPASSTSISRWCYKCPFSRKRYFSPSSFSLRLPWPACPLIVPSCSCFRTTGQANSVSKMPEMSQPARFQANLIQGQGVGWHERLCSSDHEWSCEMIQKCTGLNRYRIVSPTVLKAEINIAR